MAASLPGSSRPFARTGGADDRTRRLSTLIP
jgi:hypothetical protein